MLLNGEAPKNPKKQWMSYESKPEKNYGIFKDDPRCYTCYLRLYFIDLQIVSVCIIIKRISRFWGSVYDGFTLCVFHTSPCRAHDS